MTRPALTLALLGLVLVVSVRGEENVAEKATKSVPELMAALDSSTGDARVEVIEALGGHGAEAAAAVSALLKKLDQEEDAGVRAAAAVALGRIGADGDRVVPALISHFPDSGVVERFEPRYQVIPVFAIYGAAAAEFGEEAVDPLIEALGSDEPRVYLGAAIGLEALGEGAAKAMPKILEMLESDSTQRRNVAAGIIRGIGPAAAEAIPSLVKRLRDENFHTQYWACRALGAIGPASSAATDDLLERMSLGTVSVRRNAAIALGNIGPDIGPEAVAALLEAVDEDPMAPVREEAVIALGKLKPFADKSAAVLKKALADPDFPAPTHAARSLWLLTGDADEAAKWLTKAMGDLTYFQHAVEVLGEMGPDAAPAVDRLIEALGERDPDDRVSAALALGRIGAPATKAEPALRKLLEDEEPQVREAAQSALDALSSNEGVEEN